MEPAANMDELRQRTAKFMYMEKLREGVQELAQG